MIKMLFNDIILYLIFGLSVLLELILCVIGYFVMRNNRHLRDLKEQLTKGDLSQCRKVLDHGKSDRSSVFAMQDERLSQSNSEDISKIKAEANETDKRQKRKKLSIRHVSTAIFPKHKSGSFKLNSTSSESASLHYVNVEPFRTESGSDETRTAESKSKSRNRKQQAAYENQEEISKINQQLNLAPDANEDGEFNGEIEVADKRRKGKKTSQTSESGAMPSKIKRDVIKENVSLTEPILTNYENIEQLKTKAEKDETRKAESKTKKKMKKKQKNYENQNEITKNVSLLSSNQLTSVAGASKKEGKEARKNGKEPKSLEPIAEIMSSQKFLSPKAKLLLRKKKSKKSKRIKGNTSSIIDIRQSKYAGDIHFVNTDFNSDSEVTDDEMTEIKDDETIEFKDDEASESDDESSVESYSQRYESKSNGKSASQIVANKKSKSRDKLDFDSTPPPVPPILDRTPIEHGGRVPPEEVVNQSEYMDMQLIQEEYAKGKEEEAKQLSKNEAKRKYLATKPKKSKDDVFTVQTNNRSGTFSEFSTETSDATYCTMAEIQDELSVPEKKKETKGKKQKDSHLKKTSFQSNSNAEAKDHKIDMKWLNKKL